MFVPLIFPADPLGFGLSLELAAHCGSTSFLLTPYGLDCVLNWLPIAVTPQHKLMQALMIPDSALAFAGRTIFLSVHSSRGKR